MKSIFLILLFIFLNQTFCFSQTLFHKRISENPTNTNWTRVNFDEDGFMVVGESFFTEYSSFDYSGDLINSKKYSPNSFLTLSAFNTTKPIFSNSLSDFELFSFDDNVLNIIKSENFQFLSGKSYNVTNSLFDSSNTIFKFGKKLSDSKSVICGAYQYFNINPDDPEVGTIDKSAIIALFDSQHNLLWSSVYRLDGYYLLPEFLLEFDNNYTVIGKIGVEGAAGTPSSVQQVFIQKIDKSNGNPLGLLERYSLGTHFEIANVSSNNLFLVGGYEDFLSSEIVPTTGLIVKLNQNGSPAINSVKALQVDNFDISLLDSIEQSNDGSVYYSGTIGQYLPSGGWLVDFSHFFVGKLNGTTNNSIWSTVFSDSSPNGQLSNYGRANFIKELEDSIFAVGTFSGNNGNDYFIKINKETGLSSCKNVTVQSQLQDIPFSLNYHSVSVATNVLLFNQNFVLENEEQIPSLLDDSLVICEEVLNTNDFEIENSLVVYPNPVNFNLHIHTNTSSFLIESIKIYTIYGNNIYTKDFSTQDNIVIDTSSFSSGVYFVEATLNSGKKLVQKFIKQ
ncbi:MAG TPA: T9SS type A sorting domain-containing protein [Flavobacterium sp.]|uniref:T9SS type A sorting domain-containing protein n=1 Tax=unclassified Flavobacterium TaxID=196869 RepID=UPI0025C5ACE3|nr:MULTISPECIES: T9SS type A sorting domain-containing protein [unclassified Flavobacterium]HRE76805.1 T9SS type A sorting domain-containing protein [Flavobacterium sp.]